MLVPPQRLFAVDPSLTCSGWALFGVESKRIEAVGKIKSLSARHLFSERLVDLQSKVSAVLDQFKLGSCDVMICEAPTTMRDPRAAFQVEQVRGIFETLARERSVEVPGRLNPRSVQYEVMGLSGEQLGREVVKNTALQTVDSLYRAALGELGIDSSTTKFRKHQDIVDALLIGTLGLVRIDTALNGKVPLGQLLEEKYRGRSVKRRRPAA